MAVIDHARIPAGRDYFAALELRLMPQRVVNEFVEFLGSQEFVENNALCPNDRGSVQDADSGSRAGLAQLRHLVRGYAYRPVNAWRLRCARGLWSLYARRLWCAGGLRRLYA